MTVQDQIIESEKQLIKAMRTADVQKLDALIHDDLLFTSHMGQVVSKKQDLDAYKSGDLALTYIMPLDLHIKEYEDLAIVSTLLELEGTMKGQSFKDKVRFTRVWKCENSWRIIGGSSVLLNSQNS